ncbi:beta-ketoacyl-[acyl-carrier-protein] synthase family protein [Actinomadura sp. NPDC048955]|uniref:3-oxoacyl-[acyl-carrier-protein] synthase 2 n=1 Tax=Actinomadura luteofluorescens TaxID=46163 RepID=A0A7Y9EPD8_9ACTN|nr:MULTISPECIES: beta-ketoacyl-[acyl-carrier-protein] synthase family protein [Actinomadura]MCR3738517.1 3-oxoacyl-[acyl-carrier-protein] synthase II [Actinomadura glauciflava]NYD50690.1 3-oxoacyl-[acyl-carrier-protein] synthase II [Actinomadura luteofluorescens]
MSKSQTRVAVTGLGATTPLGGDMPSTWSALLAGESGIRKLDWEGVDDLPVQFAATLKVDPSEVMPKQNLRRLDRNQAIALIAAREAWASAGFAVPAGGKGQKGMDRPGVDGGFTVDGERLGVVLSSGIGGLHTALNSYDVFREKGWSRVSPFTVPMLMPNGASGHVGIEFGAMAGSHALVSACASSGEAVGYAIDMIRAGRADVVICGGTESCIHPLQMASFGAMRAMSTRNEEPARASRPYDKNRDGFVLGEGAAVMILESEEHARARGAQIHGFASGCGYSGDAYDIVLPDPSGSGQAKAMQRALKDAGLEPADLVHINAHATSTPAGDVAELASIKAGLGEEAARQVVITATKSMTGHLLGGAGALESIFTVLALKEGVVPFVANLEDLDDEVDLDIARDEPRKLPDGPAAALNNSFGFGGHNVSVAFERAL